MFGKGKELRKETEKNSRYYQPGWGSAGTGPDLEYQVLLQAFLTPTDGRKLRKRGKLVGKAVGRKKRETRCHKCGSVFKNVFILGSLTYLTGRRGQSQERKCVEGSQQRK